MSLDACSECKRNVRRENSHWIFDPDMRVDARRVWDGGPVIYCPRCWKARGKRAAAVDKRVSRRRRAVMLDA